MTTDVNWDASTYDVVVENGHVEILEYLHNNGCPTR